MIAGRGVRLLASRNRAGLGKKRDGRLAATGAHLVAEGLLRTW
jgi:hypothetical protein